MAIRLVRPETVNRRREDWFVSASLERIQKRQDRIGATYRIKSGRDRGLFAVHIRHPR